MPPEDRVVCRFAAEPPQDQLPYGRWAERLGAEFLAACLRIDTEGEDLGEPGELQFYPDRTWNGRTYVPVTAHTANDYEVYGHVSFIPVAEGDPEDLRATADFTAETADRNPDWRIDLCEDVIGAWRGEGGNVAAMTLVWGRPLVGDARSATAELAGLTVDQCVVEQGRFTLIAPDDYRHDILDIKIFDGRARELASESLYEDEDEGTEGAA